jgi:hypothetical protein
MLMHPSTDENFRILDVKRLVLPRIHIKMADIYSAFRDVREFNGQISKLTFVAFGHRYIQESIDSIELLLYRCLPVSVIYNTEGISESRLAPQRHAELILRPQLSSPEFPASQGLSQFVVDGTHQFRHSGQCATSNPMQLSTIQKPPQSQVPVSLLS